MHCLGIVSFFLSVLLFGNNHYIWLFWPRVCYFNRAVGAPGPKGALLMFSAPGMISEIIS